MVLAQSYLHSSHTSAGNGKAHSAPHQSKVLQALALCKSMLISVDPKQQLHVLHLHPGELLAIKAVSLMDDSGTAQRSEAVEQLEHEVRGSGDKCFTAQKNTLMTQSSHELRGAGNTLIIKIMLTAQACIHLLIKLNTSLTNCASAHLHFLRACSLPHRAQDPLHRPLRTLRFSCSCIRSLC